MTANFHMGTGRGNSTDLDILERTTDVTTEELITFEKGHYTAKLPWKEEVVDLPTSNPVLYRI